MKILKRIERHIKISDQAVFNKYVKPPPFLILFITSTCNLRCEHCFYWRSLNKNDDLSFDEIISFAKDYGSFENLNLSGGEPFIRDEIGEICRFFIRNNRVKQIYIPTNGYFTDRIEKQVLEILKEPDLQLLGIEISLDGMFDYHNRLRGNNESFEKALETYKVLERLQAVDERLRIHANTTVTADNIPEVRELTKFLYDACPKMDHHNIAIVRGDRKNQSLIGPQLESYKEIYAYVEKLWKPKDEGRFGAIVEPLLQWAKCKTVEAGNQVIPCKAGVLSAVVYANGDVSVCESREPLGNLKERKFSEMWCSSDTQVVRQRIRDRECYCTNEVFMWPSITFQPFQLFKALLGIKIWKRWLRL